MISYFNKIKKHTFIMQVATLMSGSAISQGIMFAATPFLTRLYNVEEFGVFALYLSIIGPLSVISSWRYETAIMLPKNNEDAKALLYLSIFISILMSFLMYILILIFHDEILLHLTDKIGIFLWIVPLGVLVSGFYQIFNAWNTRNELYGNISQSMILRSTTAIGIQLSSKSILNLSGGLVLGNFLASLIATLYLVRKAIKTNTLRLTNISIDSIKKNGKVYDKFPKYQSFASFINSVSVNLPIILLSSLYSLEIAGYYALTNRVLMVPVSLISGSIRNVYYQKASKKFMAEESIKSLYIKTTLNLFKIGVIPFFLVAFFAEPLFINLFGQEWLISAIFYQILFVWAIMLFINPPATSTVLILGFQKFSLVFTVLSLLLRALALYIGYIVYNDYYISIGLYACIGVLLNVFIITYILKKIPH